MPHAAGGPSKALGAAVDPMVRPADRYSNDAKVLLVPK